jgi:hypothetical protein
MSEANCMKNDGTLDECILLGLWAKNLKDKLSKETNYVS